MVERGLNAGEAFELGGPGHRDIELTVGLT